MQISCTICAVRIALLAKWRFFHWFHFCSLFCLLRCKLKLVSKRIILKFRLRFRTTYFSFEKNSEHFQSKLFELISKFVFEIIFCAVGVLDIFRKNPCHQPSAVGDPNKTCFAMMHKWYHNDENQQCEEFIYGGCGGNTNRFDTKEACEKRCVIKKR